jgi:MFS family permease
LPLRFFADSRKPSVLTSIRRSIGRGITRNVAALALVSLLTDVSSEMLVFLVPLFLANVLAASPSIIGLIEGLAESTAGVLKLASGAISDRIRRRKLLVGIGYGTSVAGKALFLVATSWPIVLLARLGDRFGKGVRTSPRDALIADSTDPAFRGRAFGFHRAMDTTGAFLGVLTAFLVVGAMQSDSTKLDAGTFQTLVLLALVPGILSVVVIAIAVRDVRRAESGPESRGTAASPGSSVGRVGRLRAQMSQLPAPFWLFVAANIVFSLGNSSDAFLALRTQSLGVAVRDLLLMIVAFNAVDALVSFPAGALSDRFGRRLPLAIAWLIYATAYAGFALTSSAGWAAGLWILYGAYYGINDAVGRAQIADVTPARLRGTGFGIVNAGVSLAVLPASIIAGLLWDLIAPSAPFWFGAACALGAVGVLAFVRPMRET